MSNLDQHEDDEQVISDIEQSSVFSDSDSMIDSPADGYFSQRPHPQQLYVQTTPQQDSKPSPEPQRPVVADGPSYSQQSFPTPTPLTQQQLPQQTTHWTTERTALLDAGPAPPDYYAATASPQEGSPSTRQYGSIAPQPWPQETLFGDREPQRMGDEESHAVVDTDKKSITRRMRGWRKSCNCMTIVNVIVVIIVIVTVVSLALSGYEQKKGNVSELWDSSQVTDGQKTNPSQPVSPDPQDPGHIFPNPKNGHCSFSKFSELWSFGFKHVQNFSLEEAFDARDSMLYELGGNIWIRPATTDQEPDIRVFVSFLSHEDVIVASPSADMDNNWLKLKFPHVRDLTGSISGHCIDAAVLVSVKKGVRLDYWNLETRYLNVFVQDGMFDGDDPWLHVAENSYFRAQGGKISADYWSSRRTHIETRSGAILGKYALRDELSIHAGSGAISVKVDPKEVDAKRPEPAVLSVGAQSGFVNVKLPIDGTLPVRDYRTTIETGSGSMTGDFILGSQSSFKSISGFLGVTGLPYNNGSQHTANFTTKTVSGSSRVYLLPPNIDGELDWLQSVHESRHGSITLKYPGEWSGKFSGSATSGSIIVRGKDVYAGSDSGWTTLDKHVSGYKGHGNSTISFAITSGSVDLHIGED